MTSDRSIVFCGFLFLLLTGCGQQDVLSELTSGSIEPERYAVSHQTTSRTDPDYEETEGIDLSTDVVERKIVREGDLVWQTASRVATAERLQTALKRHEGYLSDDQEFRHDRRVERRLVIRVATRKFDLFLADASYGVEHFDTRRITAHDVTEEFVDLDARLRVKKGTEQRCREPLGGCKKRVGSP